MALVSVFVSSLVSLVQRFQSKLGNYDKQLAEQSVEQRILQGIDNGDRKEDKTFLIDVDVVRGSVFAKNKPRHGWSHAFYQGLLRVAFAPLYWDYWCGHTSLRWAFLIMFHFFLQFVQAICFLLVDPDASNSSQDDVIIPCLLAICLGVLHAHITPTNGSRCSSVSVPDENHSKDEDELLSRTLGFSRNYQRFEKPSQSESSHHSRLLVGEVQTIRSPLGRLADLPNNLDLLPDDSLHPPVASESRVSSAFSFSTCIVDSCHEHHTNHFPVINPTLVSKPDYITHVGDTVYSENSAHRRLREAAKVKDVVDCFGQQTPCASSVPETLPSCSSLPPSPTEDCVHAGRHGQPATNIRRSNVHPQHGHEADVETTDSDVNSVNNASSLSGDDRSGMFDQRLPVLIVANKHSLLDSAPLSSYNRHTGACDNRKHFSDSDEFRKISPTQLSPKLTSESAVQDASFSSTANSPSYHSAHEGTCLPSEFCDMFKDHAHDLCNHEPHPSSNFSGLKSNSVDSSCLGRQRPRSVSISFIHAFCVRSTASSTVCPSTGALSSNSLRCFHSTGNLRGLLMSSLVSSYLHPIPRDRIRPGSTRVIRTFETPISSSRRSLSTFSIDARRDVRSDLSHLSDVAMSSDGSSSSPLLPSESARVARCRRLNVESVDEVGGGLYANPKCSTYADPKLAAFPFCELNTDLPDQFVLESAKTDANNQSALVNLVRADHSVDTTVSKPHIYQDREQTSTSAVFQFSNNPQSNVQMDAEDDTITARNRQRASFLKMFRHRAYPLRPEDRSHSHSSHKKTSVFHDLSAFSKSMNVLSFVNAGDKTAASNSSRVPELTTWNSKSRFVCRNHPNECTQRKHVSRNEPHINCSRRATVFSTTMHPRYRSRNHWADTNQPGASTRIQTASETEYDRLNSDVGSNVDSSSSPDEIEPPPPSVPKQSTVDWNVGTTRRQTPWNVAFDVGDSLKRRCTAEASQGKKRSVRISANSKRRRSSHTSKSIYSATSGYHVRRATIREPWINTSETSESEESPGPLSQANASLSNAEVDFMPILINEPTAPQVEPPSEDHIPLRSTCKVSSEQFVRTQPLPESFKQHWTSRSSTLTDTVRCYVWEGENVSKFDLTMLDIGCNVIRAVERQGISTSYIILAFVVTVALPMLSVAFHWSGFHSSQAVVNNTQLINSAPALHISRLTTGSSFATFWPADSLLGMQLRMVYQLIEQFSTVFSQPLCLLVSLLSAGEASTEHYAALETFWVVISGRWFIDWLRAPDLQGRSVIILGIILRFNIYAVIFFLLCIAERTFQQRLLYAKYFFSLTSARRARKYHVPQFRLNKLRHIKCWLTLRSYLKKRGPQRSVETIIAAAFYIVFVLGLGLCSQLISRKDHSVFSHLTNWDILGLVLAIMVFLHRFIILGTKITNKYRNFSVLITEQINLYLSVEKKPHKKDELMSTFQVLRLVESLLKEVDGPFRVCGWTVNPLVYNVFKLVLLSCFSSLLSETLGFKLKLYKLKLNAANW